MATYVMTGKGSIVGAKTRKVYSKPGEEIHADDLGSATARLVASGALKIKGSKTPAADDEDLGTEDVLSPMLSLVTPPASDVRTGSSWAEDPAKLKGLTLGDLNARILKLDPTIEPFDTTEEAIACLSRDFNKPEIRLRGKKK